MQVRHRLAGCWAVINAYIHSVRIHLGFDELDRLIERRAKTMTLETGEGGKDLDVAPRDHKQMAIGDWIAIQRKKNGPASPTTFRPAAKSAQNGHAVTACASSDDAFDRTRDLNRKS